VINTVVVNDARWAARRRHPTQTEVQEAPEPREARAIACASGRRFFFADDMARRTKENGRNYPQTPPNTQQ